MQHEQGAVHRQPRRRQRLKPLFTVNSGTAAVIVYRAVQVNGYQLD